MAIIIGAAAIAVLAPLIGWLIATHLHGGNTAGTLADEPSSSDGPTPQWTDMPTTSQATSPAQVVLPPGAVECGVADSGRFPHAARGNDVTSCPFSENVRDAMNNQGAPLPVSVDAYSPVTKRHYTMSCAMEQMVTCRGGDGAVVYVY